MEIALEILLICLEERKDLFDVYMLQFISKLMHKHIKENIPIDVCRHHVKIKFVNSEIVVHFNMNPLDWMLAEHVLAGCYPLETDPETMKYFKMMGRRPYFKDIQQTEFRSLELLKTLRDLAHPWGRDSLINCVNMMKTAKIEKNHCEKKRMKEMILWMLGEFPVDRENLMSLLLSGDKSIASKGLQCATDCGMSKRDLLGCIDSAESMKMFDEKYQEVLKEFKNFF